MVDDHLARNRRRRTGSPLTPVGWAITLAFVAVFLSWFWLALR